MFFKKFFGPPFQEVGLLIFFFLASTIAIGQDQDKPYLKKLLETVQEAHVYDAEKEQVIDSLRKALEKTPVTDIFRRYHLNRQLLQEFKVFNQDSAFAYGLKTRDMAKKLDSVPLEADAVLNLADVSVSAGMYKETLDFLQKIDPEKIPEHLKSLYYGLLGRVYSEMAEYSTLENFSADYDNRATSFRNKALEYTESGTFFHAFLEAFIEYDEGSLETALDEFRTLLEWNLTPREKALVLYFVGDIHEQLGNEELAIEFFSKAAIIDIKTATKETLAIIRLSELLFQEDNLRKASLLIEKANKDAAFYGAQHRKLQVGAILPLIEEKIIERIEEQRERLFRQNIAVSILLLFVLSLAIVIYLQVRRLKSARKTILHAHKDLQQVNNQLNEVNYSIRTKNDELARVNNQLLEANKIKEEYIGFFFSQDADIFEKFREFQRKIKTDLESDNLEKARYTLKSYNLKREKEKLLKDFDEAFIKLFPRFISEFNDLLNPEEQIWPKKGEILNKELRIFALMRLGIRHNEIIAQILGYSVNSIYAYKSKIRKKSFLDKKEFDQKLFENTTIHL